VFPPTYVKSKNTCFVALAQSLIDAGFSSTGFLEESASVITTTVRTARDYRKNLDEPAAEAYLNYMR
jgi:hypothetical protein